VTVLGELFAGFGRGRQKSKNISELNLFLAAPMMEVLPVDRRTAHEGSPIPTNWIAAAAARHAVTLVTWDAHFREIPLRGAMVLESE
jgi:predicted nucleic acid-binding protein